MCRERARADRSWRGVRVQYHTCLPCGSLRVVCVNSSPHVVRAVFGSYYACTAVHTCRGSTRVVVSNSGASILIVYSIRDALGGRYSSGTGVRGVPLAGEDLPPVPNNKLGQARPRPFGA